MAMKPLKVVKQFMSGRFPGQRFEPGTEFTPIDAAERKRLLDSGTCTDPHAAPPPAPKAAPKPKAAKKRAAKKKGS